MRALGIDWPVIPIVPIRMTEAWLLLDEGAIRDVAGRPSGSGGLALPGVRDIERSSDPKGILEAAICTASGCKGRRLKQIRRDFPAHRRQLLERLDRNGPVTRLTAWQTLENATAKAMAHVTPQAATLD
jgi:hypothetical protein